MLASRAFWRRAEYNASTEFTLFLKMLNKIKIALCQKKNKVLLLRPNSTSELDFDELTKGISRSTSFPVIIVETSQRN